QRLLTGRAGPVPVARILEDEDIERGGMVQCLCVIRAIQGMTRIAVEDQCPASRLAGRMQTFPADALTGGALPRFEPILFGHLHQRSARRRAGMVDHAALRQHYRKSSQEIETEANPDHSKNSTASRELRHGLASASRGNVSRPGQVRDSLQVVE